MKKFLLYSLVLCIATFAMVSCSDVEHSDARPTNYATLSLEGEDFIILDKGSNFVEPGYSAVMAGEDVSDKVVVTSDLDVNKSGVYSISYTITNADGFSSSAERTIVVLDPNDPVEGFYMTTPDSYRDYNGQTAYGRSFEILVLNRGDYFEIDDLLGGWYCQRAAYGSAYAMAGAVSLDDDGNMTLLSSLVPGWGDSATGLEGKYDAATSTFSWVVEYTDYPFFFHVTMTKE